jgi:hypothetical protein
MKGKKEEDIKGTALECGTFGAFHEGKGGKQRLLQIAASWGWSFLDKFISSPFDDNTSISTLTLTYLRKLEDLIEMFMMFMIPLRSTDECKRMRKNLSWMEVLEKYCSLPDALLSFVSLASEKRNNSLAPQQHETPATIKLKNIIENITL